MKKIRMIILIVFYAFALIANNNGVTEGHGVKDFLRGFSALRQIPNLRHGILPGDFSYRIKF